MKRRSYVIALSAVSCAMAAIAVVVQGYLPTARIALNVVAALFVALPLTRNSFVGALLSYICASLIGFFAVNIQALPFILLFGPYTLVMWALDFLFYKKARLPKWLKIVVIVVLKIGYFFLMFWACLQLMKVVVADITLFGFEWTTPVLYAVGFALFCLYDPLFRWAYRCMVTVIGRHVRGGASKPSKTQNISQEKTDKSPFDDEDESPFKDAASDDGERRDAAVDPKDGQRVGDRQDRNESQSGDERQDGNGSGGGDESGS